MALHNNLLRDKAPLSRKGGFTLFEIIVVMAFIAIVGTFTLLVSMDSFQSYNFHTERDILVAALQHARAQAVGNVCLGAGCTTGKAHGVSIQTDKFVIFQGTSYATRDAAMDAVLQANTTIIHSGISEVVFSELSGNSPTPGTLTISSQGKSSDITIGALGQIIWTN